MAVGVTPAATPAGASPSFWTTSGMPPGQLDEASSRWRVLNTRRWTSSKPSSSTTHLRRARSLLSRLPVCSNTRSTDSMVGSRSSLAVNGSRASAGCGLAPRPPAMNTRKPCSIEPSSRVRVAATTPTSLNMAWPQSVSQPEKLILNLRGSRWANGWCRKCWKAASAQGLMSKASYGQAPARWQPIDVAHGVAAGLAGGQPDRRQQAHDLGHLLELDEVELHVLAGGDVAPAPGEGLGDVGQHVELLGGDGAVGRLDAHHLAGAALALAVDAVVQAEDAEDVLGQIAGQVALELALELGDVGRGLGVDLSLQHPRLATVVIGR